MTESRDEIKPQRVEMRGKTYDVKSIHKVEPREKYKNTGRPWKTFHSAQQFPVIKRKEIKLKRDVEAYRSIPIEVWELLENYMTAGRIYDIDQAINRVHSVLGFKLERKFVEAYLWENKDRIFELRKAHVKEVVDQEKSYLKRVTENPSVEKWQRICDNLNLLIDRYITVSQTRDESGDVHIPSLNELSRLAHLAKVVRSLDPSLTSVERKQHLEIKSIENRQEAEERTEAIMGKLKKFASKEALGAGKSALEQIEKETQAVIDGMGGQS